MIFTALSCRRRGVSFAYPQRSHGRRVSVRRRGREKHLIILVAGLAAVTHRGRKLGNVGPRSLSNAQPGRDEEEYVIFRSRMQRQVALLGVWIYR